MGRVSEFIPGKCLDGCPEESVTQSTNTGCLELIPAVPCGKEAQTCPQGTTSISVEEENGTPWIAAVVRPGGPALPVEWLSWEGLQLLGGVLSASLAA